MHIDLQSDRTELPSIETGWIGELVERVWRKLDGKVPRERIVTFAVEAAARYADARVNTFVPILIERRLWERLQPELPRVKADDEAVFHAGPANPAGGEPGPEGSLQHIEEAWI
ncbi:MAG: hypothetical protein HY661_09480 [Betaproteobacteria bacterium]|nr:hypothetical protein [Betaproteobacteria bacterium]